MSEFWEMYKKRVAEGAGKLSKPPKEVDQNILWLKAYVNERMEADGVDRFVGKDDTFGFKEVHVNYLMHYAYEAGLKAREHSYNQAIEDKRKALDKIKDALDDIGWIDYPEH
jgi:hypothetical protein